MKQPTPSGRLLWPASDGYLHVKNVAQGDAEQHPCTCGEACISEECRGRCGCEACALAWLIHQDDRALWNAHGQLVAPEELSGCGRVAMDPRQLTLRFERRAAEKPHG